MHQVKGLWQSKFTRVIIMATLLTMLVGLAGLQLVHSHTNVRAASSGCLLNSANGNIQHVIYIQFDNTHFTRDNPNVPSDLEQSPHLLNFIKSNGVRLTNHHMPPTPPPATDFLTPLPGLFQHLHG